MLSVGSVSWYKQPLGIVWSYLIKLKAYIPNDPALPFYVYNLIHMQQEAYINVVYKVPKLETTQVFILL